MKIAIRADGGAEIGMGHISRCRTIAIECMNQGHEVCFFTRSFALTLLDNSGIPTAPLRSSDNVIEETKSFVAMAAVWGADYALVDSYEITAPCIKIINDSIPAVVIDDLANRACETHTLINGNVFAAEMDYSLYQVSQYLLGGQYTIMRHEFCETPAMQFKPEVTRVLITMGGADPNNYTPYVLSALMNLEGFVLVVVNGPFAQNYQQVEKVAASCKSQVEIHNAPSNIAEVFRSCDIAISAAGGTIYELCILGVPSIIIKQADNQRLIHDYFAKYGPLITLGGGDITLEDILQSVTGILNDDRRRLDIHRQMLQIVNRNGVANLVSSAFPPCRQRE